MSSENLFTALVAFQSSMTNIVKDKTANTGKFGYRYADIAGVIESIRDPLAANGLCYLQMLTHLDGRPALQTVLAHASGEHMESVVPFMGPLDDPQKFGGVVTYYRRYALLGILGLATDDDDAQDARIPAPSARPAAIAPAPWKSPETDNHGRPEPSQRVEEELDWSDLWGKVLRPKGIMSAQRLTELIGDYSSLSASQVATKVRELGDIPKWVPPDESDRPRPQYPASGKQVSFIRSLLTAKGMDDRAWPGWASYALNLDEPPAVNDLDKQQASTVIEQLKELPDNPGLAAALEASGR